MTIPIPPYPSVETVTVTGPVNVQGINASGIPITENPVVIGGVNAGNVTTLATDATGHILVTSTGSSASTLTSPNVTNVQTAVLAANLLRKGGTIENEGPDIVYLAFNNVVSLSVYTVQVASGGYYEIPYGYTGVIVGICPTSTGQLRVTELS